MKNFNNEPDKRSKQSGFFDLGISLLILAMSGSTAYVIERNNAEKMASLEESSEVATTEQAEIPNARISKLDAEISGHAVQ